jgi:hypothetical protein
MHKLILTAALAAALTTPAFAQNSSPSGAGAQGGNPGSGTPGAAAHSGAGANIGQRTPANASTSNMPSTWTGSSADWTTHSQACAKRYSNYDASTDMYANGGKSMRCDMAMGSSHNGSSSGSSSSGGANGAASSSGSTNSGAGAH